MSFIKKIVGPKSKYDKTLPYTYMARVAVIAGDDEICSHYFSDTICGLIEYLDDQSIMPEEVELFGLYLKKEIRLDKKYCVGKDGKWLLRPHICKSLETQYKQSLEEEYKGHVEKEACSYEDRERRASGPH
jgi:hypothetical protein